jgi:putative DNA primase/helicase
LGGRNGEDDGNDIQLGPTFVLLANKLPVIQHDDNGLWRRLKIIPFNRVYTEKEADGELGDKFMREASGILNLMLAGLLDFQVNSINIPTKVQDAISERKKQVDPIEAFLADTIVLEEGHEEQLKVLYDILYLDWKKQNAIFVPLSKRQFMARLEAKGFKTFEKGHLVYFVGLRPNDAFAVE